MSRAYEEIRKYANEFNDKYYFHYGPGERTNKRREYIQRRYWTTRIEQQAIFRDKLKKFFMGETNENP